jgi:uncharacterized protein (TIGR02246 family)
MDEDERAIRELVDRWLTATKAGDTATVLELIDDDAVFMVRSGMFGKEGFKTGSESLTDSKIDGTAEIQEMQVQGGWAWIRNHIDLVIKPAGVEPVKRSGYALTILKKGDDGRWRLFRDANLVS